MLSVDENLQTSGNPLLLHNLKLNRTLCTLLEKPFYELSPEWALWIRKSWRMSGIGESPEFFMHTSRTIEQFFSELVGNDLIRYSMDK